MNDPITLSWIAIIVGVLNLIGMLALGARQLNVMRETASPPQTPPMKIRKSAARLAHLIRDHWLFILSLLPTAAYVAWLASRAGSGWGFTLFAVFLLSVITSVHASVYLSLAILARLMRRIRAGE